MYCSNCGVELEDDMIVCPLCGKPAGSGQELVAEASARGMPGGGPAPVMDKKQKRFTWEIVSIILGSGIVAALIVNLIISRGITWSEYTTAVGLAIFCYVSVLAFFNISLPAEMAAGFLMTSAGFLLLDALTGGITWAVKLAIPLLLSANVITVIYIGVARSARYKGINLVAYAFLGAALLCLCTEAITTFFMQGEWRLGWSLIVSACIVPVVLVLLFVHFRLRKGRDLERTFHI